MKVHINRIYRFDGTDWRSGPLVLECERIKGFVDKSGACLWTSLQFDVADRTPLIWSLSPVYQGRIEIEAIA